MITNLEIGNFRGIERLELSKLKRLNLVVGPNGSGKTSLLESIFLASGGSIELLLRAKQWRGREIALQGNPQSINSALWSDTFRDPEIPHAIIDLHGDQADHNRRLEITSVGGDVLSFPRNEPIRSSSYSLDAGLRFKYSSPELGEQSSEQKFTDNQLQLSFVESRINVHFLAARVTVPESETATLFTNLRLAGRAKLFEDAMLKEFPLVEKLSIEVPNGLPAIYGQMLSGPLLPLTMISSGINHFAAILLRLVAAPRSIVLIDEIENGFYHERFKSIWRTIYTLCKRNDSQMFVSTHSLEALQALTDELQDAKNDVALLRSRVVDGEVSFTQVSGDTMFKSLEVGEVR